MSIEISVRAGLKELEKRRALELIAQHEVELNAQAAALRELEAAKRRVQAKERKARGLRSTERVPASLARIVGAEPGAGVAAKGVTGALVAELASGAVASGDKPFKRTTVQNWLRGEVPEALRRLADIAEISGDSADWLLGFDVPRRRDGALDEQLEGSVRSVLHSDAAGAHPRVLAEFQGGPERTLAGVRAALAYYFVARTREETTKDRIRRALRRRHILMIDQLSRDRHSARRLPPERARRWRVVIVQTWRALKAPNVDPDEVWDKYDSERLEFQRELAMEDAIDRVLGPRSTRPAPGATRRRRSS